VAQSRADTTWLQVYTNAVESFATVGGRMFSPHEAKF
jgi:hypothetical protein